MCMLNVIRVSGQKTRERLTKQSEICLSIETAKENLKNNDTSQVSMIKGINGITRLKGSIVLLPLPALCSLLY